VAAQIAHIQATTQLCSPRTGFTRLCRKIMQQIAPDVEFRFEFQALNALQHGTEDYCVHMFVNGSIAVAH
jgi:histone H3/H4